MQLHLLEDRIPWFGRYNGYEQLTRYLPATLPRRVFAARPGLLPRLRGKWHSLRHGLGPAPQAQVDALARFARALRSRREAVGHVLYGEHVLPYFASLPDEVLQRTAVTFHQPPAQWRAQDLRVLERVPHPLLLFTPRDGAFGGHLARPHIVPHGVDIEHFCPDPAPPAGHEASPPRILYSGVHLRNLGMLERVIDRLLQRRSDLVVDMLVPQAHRGREVFVRLARRERLSWHAGLDEHALRALYRRCHLMLLPMQDSGANTAVVEALACGLPVVTTDVGGIADYGGGTVVLTVANDDDEGMVERVLELLEDAPRRAAVSAASRRFAEDRLSWTRVARLHVALYRTMNASAA